MPFTEFDDRYLGIMGTGGVIETTTEVRVNPPAPPPVGVQNWQVVNAGQPMTLRYTTTYNTTAGTGGVFTGNPFYTTTKTYKRKTVPVITEDHPIHFLEKLGRDLGITEFQFATYEYPSNSISNDNSGYPDPTKNDTVLETTKMIKADNLIENYVNYVNSEGGYGEVAIQSSVWIGKQKYYIPFIDFICPDLKTIEEALDASSEVLQMDRSDFVLYSSGESYHAYGKVLLAEDEAIPEYASRLLLVAHPKKDISIVDSRWVGHSQLKKNFSLRLTNNKKPQLPKLVK